LAVIHVAKANVNVVERWMIEDVEELASEAQVH